MGKNNNVQHNLQSDSELNQLSAGEKREDPQNFCKNTLPGKPTYPAKPNENPDPAKPGLGENEPEKNDPTRIDEPPPIFNSK